MSNAPDKLAAARRISPGERCLAFPRSGVSPLSSSSSPSPSCPSSPQPPSHRRFQVKRQNERQLHYDLWQMRDAIDKYKDAADKGAFQTKVDSQNYPPDLETLVTGVDVQGKKLKFLRKIPIDP